MNRYARRASILLAIGFGLLFQPHAGSQTPLGTAFTFDGHLKRDGKLLDGHFDLDFKLFDAATDGKLLGSNSKASVVVDHGDFRILLDFGPGVFTGDVRWIEVSVRRTDSNDPLRISEPR